MKLKEFIEMLRQPDHLPKGVDPDELEVEFFVDYGISGELASIYFGEQHNAVCIDVVEK